MPPKIFIILEWRNKHTVPYPPTQKLKIKSRPHRAQSKDGSGKHRTDMAERDHGVGTRVHVGDIAHQRKGRKEAMLLGRVLI